MAIGKQTFTIGSEDFVQGVTSTKDTQDGGFSPESYNINLNYQQGVVFPTMNASNAGLTTTGTVLASTNNGSVAASSKAKFFVTDSKKYYSYDGASLTLEATDGSTNTYQSGATDQVFYKGNIYTTCQKAAGTGDITLWDGSGTLDTSWWVTTKGQTALSINLAIRPLQIYNGYLYIIDSGASKIYSWDGTTIVTSGTTSLTLSSEKKITATGIDPNSGKMLVAFSTGVNASDTRAVESFIGYWNGSNPNQFDKVIPVDDMVTAFYPLGGLIYVNYGNRLGVFTGNGINFLWKFNFGFTSTALGYKGHITNDGQILFFIDGQYIIAFGEVIPGKKVFNYIYKNQTGLSNPTDFIHVCSLGQGKIGVSYSGGGGPTCKLDVLDTKNIAAAAGDSLPATFYSKKYYFPRPVFIRQIIILLTGSVPNGFINAYLIDDTNTTTQFGYGSGITYGMNSTGANAKGILIGTDTSTTSAQIFLDINGVYTARGIKKMIVFYDYAE